MRQRHPWTRPSSRPVCVALVSVLLTSLVCAPARAEVLSLSELEARAIAESPALRARVARTRAASARVDGIRAEMRPRLSLDFGVGANPGAVIRTDCPGDTESRGRCAYRGAVTANGGASAFSPAVTPQASLRFDGLLYDFGRTAARVHGARAEVDAQEAELEAAEESLVRTVRGAYLQWLGAHLRHRFMASALEAAESRVREVEGALAAGARSEADRDGALIEAGRIRLETARARAALTDARRGLVRVVGVDIPQSAEPDEALLALEAPASAAREPHVARAQSLRRDVALGMARAYELRHAPVLGMTMLAGVGYQMVGGTDNLVLPSYSIQLNLSVPLWDPRASRHLVDEALAQAEAYEEAASESRLALERADEDARQRLAEVEQELALAEEVVALTLRAAEGAEQRFRIAGGSIDALLNARERHRRAEEERLRTRLDRVDAVLRLRPAH